MTAIRSLVLALCAIAPGLTALGVLAADEPSATQDPDWPCEQALVPQVSAAVVWDGPPVEGIAWRDVPQVAALVAQIAPSAPGDRATEATIAAFAGSLSQTDRERMLTLAFAGVLDVLNRDRATLIDGIKRYAQDQSRRAETLGEELDKMVQLEKDDSESAAQARQELKQRLTLEERAFDERERSIQFLCTRPVAVERRIGLLARTISGYLD
jgi:hypothetical protein